MFKAKINVIMIKAGWVALFYIAACFVLVMLIQSKAAI